MSSYEEVIWKSYLAWYVFVNFSWPLHCMHFCEGSNNADF